MKSRIRLLVTTAIALSSLLTCLTQSAFAQKNYEQWTVGGLWDQDSAKTGQHSGLVTFDFAKNGPIQDTVFAASFQPLVQNKNISFVWVFSECYGGGMFDELNGLGGTQSGVSASAYFQEAYYQVLRPLGNGVNFSTAYIEGMRDVTTVAEPMASTAADNDPWGPSKNPNPPRSPSEAQFAEQPIYFSTGAAGDALDLKDHAADGAVILWSGQPKLPLDSVEIRALVLQFVALGYNPQNIYVLFGKGTLSGRKDLVGEVVKTDLSTKQLRAATNKQLQKVINVINGDDDIKFVFFFANDHGWNNVFAPNGLPRVGGDLYPSDPPAEYTLEDAYDEVGQGDSD
ncbi:MAG TPA: hypothetical protein VMD98_09230 [Bryocella sp.]|nr:hypothetical protein [Bryocella sp.]